MNTLEQLTLLEQKVESAVKKIQQLQAENDALRNKCTELTNALSAKSEQLSSFESDKGRIATGIQKALERLNSIENSMLQSEISSASILTQEQEKPVTVINEPEPEQQPEEAQSSTIEFDQPQPILNIEPEISQSFDTMDNLEEDENQQNGDFGFDIF